MDYRGGDHSCCAASGAHCSAGHSDTDPGIVANGRRESDIVLEFRDLLSGELAALGIRHLLDGDPGENLPLRDAVNVAAKCDIAIGFHTDAASPADDTLQPTRSIAA
nr:N-acetylmuramoyl-L-alanine amidase [Halomonas endophytica]